MTFSRAPERSSTSPTMTSLASPSSRCYWTMGSCFGATSPLSARTRDPAACPKRRAEELSIDTSSFANGSHRLRIRTTDAAGNIGESEPTRAINVRNVRDPEDPPSRGGRVTAEFVGTTRRTLRVAYSRRVKVRGQVTNANGEPVVSAAIGLIETVAGNEPSCHTPSRAHRRGWAICVSVSRPVVVPAQYVFSICCPARTSRWFPPVLKLKVRAAALLKVSLRGVRVRYQGRLVSGPVPSAGVVVVMQGRRERGTWQPFAYRKVRRRGTFDGDLPSPRSSAGRQAGVSRRCTAHNRILI